MLSSAEHDEIRNLRVNFHDVRETEGGWMACCLKGEALGGPFQTVSAAVEFLKPHTANVAERHCAVKGRGYRVQGNSEWFGVNWNSVRITEGFQKPIEALEALEDKSTATKSTRLKLKQQACEQRVARARIPESHLGATPDLDSDFYLARYAETFSPQSGDMQLCGTEKLRLACAVAEEVARKGFHSRYATAAEILRFRSSEELLAPDLLVLNLGQLPATMGDERNAVLAAIAAPIILEFLKQRRDQAEERRRNHAAAVTRGATITVADCNENELSEFLR